MKPHSKQMLEELEPVLKALANANRLQALYLLQEPKGYRELDLTPSRDGPWGSTHRSISRPAVRNHLQPLLDIGLVVEHSGEGPTKKFIVDHSRLFTITEQLRMLSRIEPNVAQEGVTVDLDAAPSTPNMDGPHLALVRGVREGQCFQLSNKPEWWIGRSREVDVVLDYDPYISARHARVVCRGADFFLNDKKGSKNGTYLNWSKMASGGISTLKPGDIVGVGMSLLVFRI